MKKNTQLLALLPLLSATAVGQNILYQEDFSSGLGGWTAAGSGSSIAVHNNITERAAFMDTGLNIGFFLAPTSSLSGDLSELYGGSVSFDLYVPDGSATDWNFTLPAANAFIWGANGDALVLNLPNPVDGLSGEALNAYIATVGTLGNWGYLDANTTFDPLTFRDSLDDVNFPLAQATEAQFNDVLSDVAQVGVRAEFDIRRRGSATASPGDPDFLPETELDNFIVAAVPEPNTALLALLASLSLLRRRR